MGYMDERLVFADDIDASSAAWTVGDFQLGDIIDLMALATVAGATSGDHPKLEVGTILPLLALIKESLTQASGTCQFVVQSSDSATFASGNIDQMASKAYAAADLTAGTKIPNLFLANTGQRYMRLIARVTSANVTNGTIFAAAQIGRQANEG